MESQNFHGQEYLGLYPYLEYAEYSNKNQYEFWVDNQEKMMNLQLYESGLMEKNHINTRRWR